MYKPFKDMTYKDFCDYCNKRACDGNWAMNDALSCIIIMNHINSIEVKILGFHMKKKTEQLREKEWKKLKWE